MAADMAALSLGSTLKHWDMLSWAISMLSASSELRVPSLSEVFRKLMIASARRCWVVVAAYKFVGLEPIINREQVDLPCCDVELGWSKCGGLWWEKVEEDFPHMLKCEGGMLTNVG
jgi:hypothetical protein